MRVMKTSKPLQIFKPGKHTAMSGDALSFSEADLAATAAAYDPAKHEAPIVIGHPKHDSPAYGWVGRLAFADGGLEADPIHVNPDFAEMVSNGLFKKISSSFYAPDSPSNPVPGVYYLRHVGMLGAQPPSVKGLRNPEFSDSEKGVIEFADWDDMQNASLWRAMREWLIGKFGVDEADKVIPGYTVSNLEVSAQQEDEPDPTTTGAAIVAPSFSETHPKGDEMSAEDKTRLAELEARNKTLEANQVAFAEAEKKRAGDARHADHAAFAEALAKDGKLLPAQKDVAVATLDFMANQDKTVEFGEGDAKKPLVDAFKGLLQALPKQVEFSEVGAEAAKSAAAATQFSAAPGYVVDADKMATHMKALSYAEQNKCDYVTAVKAVENT